MDFRTFDSPLYIIKLLVSFSDSSEMINDHVSFWKHFSRRTPAQKKYVLYNNQDIESENKKIISILQIKK